MHLVFLLRALDGPASLVFFLEMVSLCLLTALMAVLYDKSKIKNTCAYGNPTNPIVLF